MMGYQLSSKHNILYSISHETNFGYVTKKENDILCLMNTPCVIVQPNSR